MQMIAVDGWRDYLNSHDDEALRALLHPDIVFESPILGTPQRGAELGFKYLAGAARALGGPNFRWIGEWQNETGAVLEFINEIEGICINAVDIITLSADTTLITQFKVMIRPLKAINLVKRLMSEQLQKS